MEGWDGVVAGGVIVIKGIVDVACRTCWFEACVGTSGDVARTPAVSFVVVDTGANPTEPPEDVRGTALAIVFPGGCTVLEESCASQPTCSVPSLPDADKLGGIVVAAVFWPAAVVV